MTTTTQQTKQTTQVYRVYIAVPAQKVWDAITQPEWTEKYGYGGRRVRAAPRWHLPRVHQRGDERNGRPRFWPSPAR